MRPGEKGRAFLDRDQIMNVYRAFPDQNGDGIVSGPKRNFQILSPLDFLAEFTQHIPAKGSHLIRYYGWYSNKARGMRKKAEVEASAEPSSESEGIDVCLQFGRLGNVRVSLNSL